MTSESQVPNHGSPQEPSVLDYLKSKLSAGGSPRIEIPLPGARGDGAQTSRGETAKHDVQRSKSAVATATWPWRSLLALGLALLAQHFYEPATASPQAGSVLYVAALGLLVWAAVRGEWTLESVPAATAGNDPLTFRRRAFIAAIPFMVLAFLFFRGNMFTGLNLMLWLIALGLFVWSMWLNGPQAPSLGPRLRAYVVRERWQLTITRWTLLLVAASTIVVFFRVYHIQQTPAEPFSDHAEKLLDVYDVSQGQTHIFFPRNTGREGIQMYWTLVISWIFGTGLSFLSLKIGTILIGLFTLPYVYLLGREVASRRVGLLAFLLAGIGYWPNVISRIGLRFPLYALFVAPVLLYLIRGLRNRNRNDFIVAGIFLGLGLHGYSPFRIVPILVVAAFVLFALHAQSKGARQLALIWLVISALTSLIILLPLLRYATENPALFSYRAMSRFSGVEQALPGPWFQVFLSNTWNALKMFNWNNGSIWVHSLPNRPALDVVTGSLFLMGVVLLLVRYVQKGDWLDLFLLLSIPILLLPSILSLAFPGENPALNRTAGAIVPTFLVAAMALDGLIRVIAAQGRGSVWAYVVTGVLLWVSASQNFDLVFRQFDQNFRVNAWNSSEMGAIVKQFGLAYGETDTAWVVPFPYWVDTRLVGVWAGIPNRDFAIWPDQLAETLQSSGPKLFIVKASLTDPKANDQQTVDLLRRLYPQGALSLHRSAVPERDFWVYFVPALTSP